MALITCPDCGKSISSSAPACIGCGRPAAAASAELSASPSALKPSQLSIQPQRVRREWNGKEFVEQVTPEQANDRKQYAEPDAPITKWIYGAVAVGVLIITLAVAGGSGSNIDTRGGKAGVTQSVIGTWTGSQDFTSEIGVVVWTKYIFSDDGTFTSYSAHANAGGWPSTPDLRGQWQIGEGKYSNTGEHYFFVELNWVVNDERNPERVTARFPIKGSAILMTAEDVDNPLTSVDISALQRGDHFPR